MNYDKVSEAMYDDLENWLVTKHSVAIKTLYSHLIESYLEEKMGELNDKCHRKLVHHLLERLIRT